MKRKDYISWDEYFMGTALLASKRSKDPNTQVGACIVNDKKRIMSIGYNGFPMGCDDDSFPWERAADNSFDTKYPYVCHAELNAILNNRGANLEGCTIYVGLFPCCECAKAIIQSGIKKIIYLSDKYKDSDSTRASKRMLTAAGVELEQIKINHKQIVIDFDEKLI